MAEFKVDEIVVHRDYPDVKGKIIGRYRSSDIGAHVYLVLWNYRSLEARSQSRHIAYALRRV